MTTYSDHWYRVAPLHPRLRSHVRLDRHCYRGEVWHVLKDPISGRQHRVNPVGYRIVGRLDGRLSVQEIWDLVVVEAGDEAPTQPETIALLARLHEGELIQSEQAPDVAALFDRAQERSEHERRQRVNPFALRVGLIDPTPLLDALAPLAAPLLRRWAMWAWLALMVLVGWLLVPQSAALLAYAKQHLDTPRMLLILWLVYPVTKALHELAHALAVRVWGGAVREMGISLLMLTPVPYVDASAAAGFRERSRRVVVSLVGILAETTLAALAALLWVASSDGLVREIAFAVMLIGGVSTVVFNGNPLLRFDAYHALVDAIESPGLAARSQAWWRWFAQRYLIGLAQAQPPLVAAGERRWLIGYGLAAGIYRYVVGVLVVGWLVGIHPVLGAVGAVWLIAVSIVRPAGQLARYVLRAPELQGRRARAALLAGLALSLPTGLVFGAPFPAATRAPGIVWAPAQAQVRTDGEGFVERVAVSDGQAVVPGELIVQLADPTLQTELDRVQARLRGLDVAYQTAVFEAPAQANDVAQEIRRAQAERERIEARIDALAVRSAAAGRIALVHPQDLPGVFVPRGALVAHVLTNDAAQVRVVVSQAEIARVFAQPGPIEVRLDEARATTLPARLHGQTPSALRELPSAALGDRAGGPIPTEPDDPQGLRTPEALYTVDLTLPQHASARLGGRAWVRFDHGHAPLAVQWWQQLQQLFLGQLVS